MELRSIFDDFIHSTPYDLGVCVLENTRLGFYKHHYPAGRSDSVWPQKLACACRLERRTATLGAVSIAITHH
jgi:hypothetical protein